MWVVAKAKLSKETYFSSTIYRVALFPVLMSLIMQFQQLNDNAEPQGWAYLDMLELLEQQTQTWCLCCCNSGIPGVEAFVVSRYPEYLSEREVRQLFEGEGYPTSYWVEKLPTTVNYLYESSGEWEA